MADAIAIRIKRHRETTGPHPTIDATLSSFELRGTSRPVSQALSYLKRELLWRVEAIDVLLDDEAKKEQLDKKPFDGNDEYVLQTGRPEHPWAGYEPRYTRSD